MNLTNVKVKSVKKGVKTGSGKWGPWTLHIVTLDDPDWAEFELSFFEDKNTKVLPEEGVDYALAEIEETKQGYQLRKLTPMQAEKPKPDKSKARGNRGQQGGGGGGGGYQQKTPEDRLCMYMSYAKDLAVALIAAGKGPLEIGPWFGQIAAGGKYLHLSAEGKAAPPMEQGSPNGGQPEEIPEGTVLVKNVTPLVKLMCAKVVGWSMKTHEKTARELLPRAMTPDRYNALQEVLSNADAVEDHEMVAHLGKVVKEYPVKEEK